MSCDRCQEVCPNNRQVRTIKKKIPRLNPEFRHSPALLLLLSISEEAFEKHFLDCDFIDPKLKYLRRNVIVALGNIGDPVSLLALSKMLKSRESMIRAHVAWAIGRIGGFKAKRLLHDALNEEKDVDVKRETDEALQNFA